MALAPPWSVCHSKNRIFTWSRITVTLARVSAQHEKGDIPPADVVSAIQVATE